MLRWHVLILSFIVLMSPYFYITGACAQDVPAFTDSDLENYKGRAAANPAQVHGSGDGNTEPSDKKAENFESLLRQNISSVVVVAAYNDKGVSFSHGSGFIVSKNGAIVTSYHVIRNASSIKVKTQHRILDAGGVLYLDSENDIAIIKADAGDLPFAKFGDSDTLESGENVYVLGSPESSEQLVSQGFFNGERVFGGNRRMLQISAPFSEGTSGGPVLNSRGEVIGIATSAIQGAKNLNFAVPANIIKDKISAQAVTSVKNKLAGDYMATAEYWLKIGNNFNTSEEYDDAMDAYEKALKINPDLAEAYNGLGVASLKLKRYKKAVDAFQQALRINPNSAWAHANLGLAYTETGRHQEAVSELEEAVRIIPEMAEAYFNLGLAFRRLGRYEKAVEAYRQAVAINPGFEDAHYALGIVYLYLKDKDSALEEYDILKDMNPALAEKLLKSINR